MRKKYQYRVVWKRDGWSGAQHRSFAKVETALRHVKRVETGETWQNPDTGETYGYDKYGNEGPWKAKALLYVKMQRRQVGPWEDVLDSDTESPTS